MPSPAVARPRRREATIFPVRGGGSTERRSAWLFLVPAPGSSRSPGALDGCRLPSSARAGYGVVPALTFDPVTGALARDDASALGWPPVSGGVWYVSSVAAGPQGVAFFGARGGQNKEGGAEIGKGGGR